MKLHEICPTCGKPHAAAVEEILAGKHALQQLPATLQKRNINKVFLLADANTWAAAGEKTAELLRKNGVKQVTYVFPASPEPDEKAVGAALMRFDPVCDAVVAVGSGVLNDIGKIVSHTANKPYVVVATAPSMDGYASATSSMNRDGVKVSLPSKCAEVIVGDTDILKNAPMHMLQSGLGDMAAKYISICEWRIGHMITGEYYCETVAELIREALRKCAANAEGLLKREDAAVEAVFEGLLLGGLAMAYAGVSRPASGAEHYFSHVWDMRALEFGTPADLHGLQCAVGTMEVRKLYEKLRQITPDREAALRHARDFNLEEYYVNLRAFLGTSADPLIALEQKEGKCDPEKHAKRLEIILQKWPELLSVMEQELPSMEQLQQLYDAAKLPQTPRDIGLDDEILPMTLLAAKDIRDKYVLPRLLWDLGIAL